MNLLAPTALVGLALLPLVIAMHLWRVRYRKHVVSSTLLWSRVLSETPLRRPRRLPTRYLLLLLQLTALLGGVAALSRPGLAVSGSHRRLIVAVDTSLAMSANDTAPSRLARARDAVLTLIDGMRTGDTMTLIDVGSSPRVLTTSGDHGALRRATESLTQGMGPSSLFQDGPLLRGVISSTGRGATTYLFAPFGTPSDVTAALNPSGSWFVGRLRSSMTTCGGYASCLLLLGNTTDDRAISGFTVSCAGQGRAATCEAFGRLINTAARRVTARVTAVVDGASLSQDVTLAAGSASPIGLDLPAGASVVELRIDGRDVLPADDVAWAVVPRPYRRTALLVTGNSTTSGDPGAALLQALQAIPNLSVRVTTPDAYTDDMARAVDLTILDSPGDTTSAGIDPPSNLLIINPVGSTPEVSVLGTSRLTGIAWSRRDDLLLKGVDLSSLVVSSAATASVPSWARTDVMSSGGPLLYSGITGSRRVAVLLFDPRTSAGTNPSNLDTLLAFPTLLYNAVLNLAPSTPLEIAAGVPGALTFARQASAAQLAPAPLGSVLHVERPIHLRSPSDLAAAPSLAPGLYSASSGAGDVAHPLAVNAEPPIDPVASRSADVSGAPESPVVAPPALVTVWEEWAILAALALIALSGEWWYYVRRT